MWRSKALEWTLIVLVAGAIAAVTVALVDPQYSADAYWVRISIAASAMVFLCLSFFYFTRSRRAASRAFLVTATLVPQPAVDVAKIGDAAFWTAEETDKNLDCICSVCLSGPEPEVKDGLSRCCHSFFHRDCVGTYWESVNGVVCPNCRSNVSDITAV